MSTKTRPATRAGGKLCCTLTQYSSHGNIQDRRIILPSNASLTYLNFTFLSYNSSSIFHFPITWIFPFQSIQYVQLLGVAVTSTNQIKTMCYIIMISGGPQNTSQRGRRGKGQGCSSIVLQRVTGLDFLTEVKLLDNELESIFVDTFTSICFFFPQT